MLRKFVSGLVAGLGLSISSIATYTAWVSYILPFPYKVDPTSVRGPSSELSPVESSYTYEGSFRELPLDEKISNSTAVIVTNIEKDKAGKYRSTVTEVLKKQDDVELYYEVGDIYEDYSDYNQYEAEGRFVPRGFVIFMGGDPARMIYATSYSGERIGSLGGIPMELLREKCRS